MKMGCVALVPSLDIPVSADNMYLKTGATLVRQAAKAVNQMLQNTVRGGGE